MRLGRGALALLALLIIGPPTGLLAQVGGAGSGAVDVALLLRQLDGEKRVLMIGAHPDDEDTSLLTALARGQGARTAYLSLSRGEGGQNLIGPELGEGLGLIRTGELLAARSIDGAEQYFTRAFDFGFSKTAEETFRHWPREELLRDVVWIVRSFRPHVILSIFHGTPQDGHGQHQAAGVVAHEAFEAAADSSRFPDQLGGDIEPWRPLKLYRLVRRDPKSATVRIDTGAMDPLLGRSFFQVAMESRSQHRSQDMGTAQTPGPRTAGAALVESRVSLPEEGETGIFTGVDTALVQIARLAGAAEGGELLDAVGAYREALRDARERLHVEDPGRSVDPLLRAEESLRLMGELAGGIRAGGEANELVRILEARRHGISRAVLSAASIVVDIRLDRERLVPGEEAELEVLVWNGGHRKLEVEGVDVGTPARWGVRSEPAASHREEVRREEGGEGPALFQSPTGIVLPVPALPTPVEPVSVAPGALQRWTYRISVPEDEEPSSLYFLREDREGSLYRWPDAADLRGRAIDPAPVTGRLALRVDGQRIRAVEREAEHVVVDKAVGEFRVPVFVTPALAVEVEPDAMAWPEAHVASRTVTVRVTNHAGAIREAELSMAVPNGWTVEPATHAVRLAPSGGDETRAFRIHPAENAPSGAARFQVRARLGARAYSERFTLVDYPHLDPAPFRTDAELRVSRFPVEVAEGVRVGYVMGPGDAGVRALEDLGVAVQPLSPTEIRSGDLDRFDVVVLGVRAYETRTDLIASNQRLLDFASRGGTVIVQYNKYEYPDGGFAPYPLAMRRPHDRVTDPEAAVTFLDSDHPLLSTPNRITSNDFDGWTQERGLYFLSEWDDRYTPLLEMADPGEEPNHGSLVVTQVGDGAYVYTGLALFRQLPAGVPGAFRLLANLVSLTGNDLRERAEEEAEDDPGRSEAASAGDCESSETP